MGLFKNIKADHDAVKDLRKSSLGAAKDMTAMAAQMSEQYAGAIAASQSMDLTAVAAMGQRINHLMANGVDGTATLVSVRELGPGIAGNGTAMEFALTVTDGPGAPRPLTVHQDMMGSAAAYQPGQQLQVKIDPNNPDDAMLGATPPGGSDTRIMKLEQLAAMHKAGAFTDEEFAQKKAAVLAEE
jgi:hypothetical protein